VHVDSLGRAIGTSTLGDLAGLGDGATTAWGPT
jgi:hypothetical protein